MSSYPTDNFNSTMHRDSRVPIKFKQISSNGTAEAFNGNTSATPGTLSSIIFNDIINNIIISNIEQSNPLQVSFDNSTWYTINAQGTLSLSVIVTNITLKSTAASVGYSILVTYPS